MDTTTIMANMGLGIDPETCLDVVNEILNKKIDIAAFFPVSLGVAKRIVAQNPHFLRHVQIPLTQSVCVKQTKTSTTPCL